MKKCNKCLINKDLNSFYNNKASKDGKTTYCKECINNRQRIWRENNQDHNKNYHIKNKETISKRKKKTNDIYYSKKETKDKVREYYLVNTHGITLDVYNYMLEKQEGCCSICGIHISELGVENLYVDHNHKNGNVRGLLCSNCNLGIGHFKDNIDLLENAIKYLKQHE